VVVLAGVAVAGFGAGGSDGEGSTAAAPSTPSWGGELRARTGVPVQYREAVTDGAHRCASSLVTPSLLAAIVETASGFDPRAERPERDEVGIALWTPSIFERYAVDADGGGADPRSPTDALATLGGYLCAAIPAVERLDGDPGALLAGVYRNGVTRLEREGGLPAASRPFARRVVALARAWGRPPGER
ncbi:MAG TPA: hypothetical protein VN238_11130, partial [Solirubrobacteraceae bacterium]|nr:hypothetical protein [Solirubrobacteraceae bacterium]